MSKQKVNKVEAEIRRLMKADGNKTCADCPEKVPGYLDTTHWIFVCTKCSGIHREFQFKVKGVSMSTFTEEDVANVANMGNEAFNSIYMAKFNPKEYILPNGSDINKLKDFIRLKYIEKKWHQSSGGSSGFSTRASFVGSSTSDFAEDFGSSTTTAPAADGRISIKLNNRSGAVPVNRRASTGSVELKKPTNDLAGDLDLLSLSSGTTAAPQSSASFDPFGSSAPSQSFGAKNDPFSSSSAHDPFAAPPSSASHAFDPFGASAPSNHASDPFNAPSQHDPFAAPAAAPTASFDAFGSPAPKAPNSFDNFGPAPTQGFPSQQNAFAPAYPTPTQQQFASAPAPLPFIKATPPAPAPEPVASKPEAAAPAPKNFSAFDDLMNDTLLPTTNSASNSSNPFDNHHVPNPPPQQAQGQYPPSYPGYPPQQYPQPNQGPGGYPVQAQQYPGAQPGYYPNPNQPYPQQGYPPQGYPGYPPQGQPNYPQQGQPNYPPQGQPNPYGHPGYPPQHGVPPGAHPYPAPVAQQAPPAPAAAPAPIDPFASMGSLAWNPHGGVPATTNPAPTQYPQPVPQQHAPASAPAPVQAPPQSVNPFDLF